MRILYHHRTLGDGAEGVHIHEMVQAFRALGHTVRVVSLIGGETQRVTVERARWSRIASRIPPSAYELAELSYNLVGTRRLRRAIREFHPDVIYDRYNSYSTAALRAARWGRIPVILEVNAPVAYERTASEHLRLKLPWLARWYERRICRGVDYVVAVSSPLKRHLVEVLGLSLERIAVLPNGANPETFRADVDGSHVRLRYGLGEDPVVGFVGILRPWHGLDIFLSAVACLSAEQPRLRVLIVGDGPSQRELEDVAERLGVRRRVVFTGRVPHAEVKEHVAAMDVAVAPRATFYASPMKILEYMAMAKPVVAPDLENIRDIVEPGETGVLFAPDSPESLSAAIGSLLNDAEFRGRIGRVARQRIETKLNWRRNALVVVRCIERLGRARRTPTRGFKRALLLMEP